MLRPAPTARPELGELESEQPRAGGQIATIAFRESDHATRHDPGGSSPLNSVVGACQSGRMLFGRKRACNLTSAAWELVAEASVRLAAIHDMNARASRYPRKPRP